MLLVGGIRRVTANNPSGRKEPLTTEYHRKKSLNRQQPIEPSSILRGTAEKQRKATMRIISSGSTFYRRVNVLSVASYRISPSTRAPKRTLLKRPDADHRNAHETDQPIKGKCPWIQISVRGAPQKLERILTIFARGERFSFQFFQHSLSFCRSGKVRPLVPLPPKNVGVWHMCRHCDASSSGFAVLPFVCGRLVPDFALLCSRARPLRRTSNPTATRTPGSPIVPGGWRSRGRSHSLMFSRSQRRRQSHRHPRRKAPRARHWSLRQRAAPNEP
jgi:hypothetical protein